MKFANRIEELKKINEERIMLARCGAFVIAIGEDAIFLSQMFGFKLNCFKSRICKIGIPITYILKYLQLLEEKGYSYILYDYNKNTKEIIEKIKYDGVNKIEIKNKIGCERCENYINNNEMFNISIEEFLNTRKRTES